MVWSGAFSPVCPPGGDLEPTENPPPWLRISLSDGRDGKHGHQLAPRAVTHSDNWDSAGIHMPGLRGGAAPPLSPAGGWTWTAGLGQV